MKKGGQLSCKKNLSFNPDCIIFRGLFFTSFFSPHFEGMKRTPTTELDSPSPKTARQETEEVADEDGVWVISPGNTISDSGRFWLSIKDLKAEDYVVAELTLPAIKPSTSFKEEKLEKARALFTPKSGGGTFRVKSFFINKPTLHWIRDNWDLCERFMKKNRLLYIRIFKCCATDPIACKFDRCKRGFSHYTETEFTQKFESCRMMHPLPITQVPPPSAS